MLFVWVLCNGSFSTRETQMFSWQILRIIKKLINNIIMEKFQLPVLSFKEMSNPNGFLCHHCHHCHIQANKCIKLQDEIKKIKDNFLSMVSNLTTLPAAIVTKKRSASARDGAEMNNSTVVQSERFGELGTASLCDVTTSWQSD